MNTSTGIVTFLAVLLLQNSQNRDTRAIHLKLDELLRSIQAARNELVDDEDLSDDEMVRLRLEFHRLGERERHEREEIDGGRGAGRGAASRRHG